MADEIKKYRIADLVLIGPHPTLSKNWYNSHGIGDRGIVLEASDCQGVWQYVLYVEGAGRNAWYWHDQLTLLARDQAEMLEQWEQKAEREKRQQSELPWIFENYDKVTHSLPGASVQALSHCLGLGSLWGKNGEGVTYYTRTTQVMEIARPFLLANDLTGWEEYCELFKRTQNERKEKS